MLRDVARELLAEKSSPTEVRKLAEAPIGQRWSEPLWQQLAEIGLLGVTVDEQHGDPERGVTLFAVPRDAPGLTVTPNQSFDETCKTGTVDFEDVPLGRESVIGQLDEGWPVLRTVLQWASVGAAAEMLGAARKCM